MAAAVAVNGGAHNPCEAGCKAAREPLQSGGHAAGQMLHALRWQAPAPSMLRHRSPEMGSNGDLACLQRGAMEEAIPMRTHECIY